MCYVASVRVAIKDTVWCLQTTIMADEFSRKTLKVVVALICQTIGWNCIQSTPLEIMIDLLQRYLVELGRVTHRYAELFGHTDPNLDDLGLAFRDMGINLQDLEEYIKNVDCVPCQGEIAKFPIPRDSHLNFLKPGSREVVTRPVHVHEHLPPMYPEMEEEEYVLKQSPLSIDTSNNLGSTSPLASPKSIVFKRPGDPISLENPALKRARMIMEEEGRPLREISSVMMTTSGFLSPAREGKLPESRTPLQPSDSRSNSPQPSSYPMVPPEVKGEKKLKKTSQKKSVETVKKTDKENKKEHKLKELGKVNKNMVGDESKVKKLVSMKELSKLKALKPGAVKMSQAVGSAGPSASSKSGKLSASRLFNVKPGGSDSQKTIRHNSASSKSRAEKSQATVAPSFQQKLNSPDKNKDTCIVEGKLSTEPDKQKLNIFKKISKVKEEKVEKIEKIERADSLDSVMRDSRESSPRLIIDESEISSRQREARMAQIDDCIDAVIQQSMEIADEERGNSRDRSPPIERQGDTMDNIETETEQQLGSDELYPYDDDLSPPGTPSTPKTPELPTPPRKIEKSAELKEKKKKKEKARSKKESRGKSLKGSHSPKKIKSEVIEEDSPEKPKTPEPPESCEPAPSPVFPFFSHFPPTPGLIPPPIGHPLFPRFPLPLGKNLPHPAMPNVRLPPPRFMQPLTEEVSELTQKTPEKTSAPSSPTTSTTITKPDSPEKIQISSQIVKKSLEKKAKDHRKERKDKAKKKKEKKLKAKKDKSDKKKIKLDKKERVKEKIREKKEKKEKRKEKEREEKMEKSEAAVPKITFKLASGSPQPPSPEAQPRKIVIKPVMKKEDEEEGSEKEQQCSNSEAPVKREPSPELARISALITRPPKTKPSSKPSLPKPEETVEPPTAHSPVAATVSSSGSSPESPPSVTFTKFKKSPKPNPKFKAKDVARKIGAEVEEQKEPVAYYYDNGGNKVWICPACGGQDDGSPMIGCDDCDAWYHWVCVGIQVPPDENENWYCRVCIVKKQENVVDRKKKSRKRKIMS